jgi:hypothetical protein
MSDFCRYAPKLQHVLKHAVHCYRCICCGWTWSSAKEPTRCEMCGGQLRDLTAEVTDDDDDQMS